MRLRVIQVLGHIYICWLLCQSVSQELVLVLFPMFTIDCHSNCGTGRIVSLIFFPYILPLSSLSQNEIPVCHAEYVQKSSIISLI